MKKLFLFIALILSFQVDAQLIGAGRRGAAGSGGGTTIDTANIAFKNRAATITGLWNFTTNPTYNGSALVNLSGGQTLTNKGLNGLNNSFSNIPSTAINNTTFATLAGSNTFPQVQTFTDTYANGQASFGQTGQSARVLFNNGVNGVPSLIIGYTSSSGAIPEIRSSASAGLGFTNTNVSAPMWFTTGGSESARILANGSFLIGQIVDNAGGKLQVTGNSTFSGDILNDANNTRNIGTLANRYAGIYSNTVWSGNFLNSSSSFYGTTNIPSQIAFRQGTGSQLIGGFYGTTGNLTLQSSGTSLGTDTGERLQVEGTARISGNLKTNGNISQGINGNYFNYNTADETTNYERGYSRWDANSYTLGIERGGTGQDRDFNLTSGIGSRILTIRGSANASRGLFTFAALSGGAAVPIVSIAGNNLGTSAGTQYSLALMNSVSQSGNAGYIGYYASIYEVSVGSGVKNLIDVGTNTAANNAGTHTSKFTVSNTGRVTIADAPVYADNAAATTAGLPVGTVYRTSTGVLMIRY